MIVLYIAQSLDGFIAEPDGSISWLDPYNDNTESTYEEFLKGIDTVVMGRKTYDQVLTFGDWPYVGKKCFVFTSGEIKEPPSNADVSRVGGDVTDFVNKECKDKRVWLLGGAGLTVAFKEARLIDEYIISTMPVLLGAGIPLFPPSKIKINLKCTATRLFKNGIVENRYLAA